MLIYVKILFFFFNDTATTEIYTLSLHDALPISGHQFLVVTELRLVGGVGVGGVDERHPGVQRGVHHRLGVRRRSEEHTSELQSRQYLVCRLLLEKKKTKQRCLLCR